jgi:hypothetical protein
MKCLPSVTLLLLPSKDSLKIMPKKALPGSQMRMFVQIVAVAERLAKVSALSSECSRHIIEGFTWCSVNVFKQTFAHQLVAEHLQQL